METAAIEAQDPDNPDMYRGMMVGFVLVETLIDGYITSHNNGMGRESRGEAFMSQDRRTAEHKARVPTRKVPEETAMMAQLHNLAKRLGYQQPEKIDILKAKLTRGIVVGMNGINIQSEKDGGDLVEDQEGTQFLLKSGNPDWLVRNVHVSRFTHQSHKMIEGLLGVNMFSLYQQIHSPFRRSNPQ